MIPAPLVSISIGGADVTSRVWPLVISLSITDAAGAQSDHLSLELDDTDGQIVLPRVGVPVVVQLGRADSGLGQAFEGTVDEVRSTGGRGGGMVLVIDAKGVDTLGTAKQPQFLHVDDADLKTALQKAGQAAGISDIRVDPALANLTREYWALDNESLLAFGERLAREVGGVFKLSGTRAVLARRGGGAGVSGAVLPTVTAAWGENLIDWDLAPSMGRPRVAETVGRWYDPAAGKHKTATKKTDDTGAKARHQRRFCAADETEATGHAGAEAEESADRRGGGSVTIIGTLEATPEGFCLVIGARPGIDGRWRIESVTHEVSRSGWTTRLSLKRPDEAAGTDGQ